MKKTIFMAVMLIFAAVCAQAQSEKPRIFVEKITKADAVSGDNAVMVRQGILDGLTKTGRFELIDAVTISDLEPELEKRQREMADFILNANVLTVSTNKKVKDGKTKYGCALKYTITLTDAKEQTTVGTKAFDHSPSGLGGVMDALELYDSPEKAIAGAAGMIDLDLKEFVIDVLPIEGTVNPADYEAKKDKLEKCYINVGSSNGVKKGDYFAIMEATTRAGRTVYKEIAQLKVEEVIDETLSFCKVTKKQKEALKVMEKFAALDEQAQAEKPLKVKQIQEQKKFGIF